VIDVKYNNILVATIGNVADIEIGKQFSSNPLDPLQYGLFRLQQGEILQRHIHKVRSRLKEHKTIEFIYIVSGELETTFYTLEKIEFAQRILKAGDFAMLYDGGHGFKVLKQNTTFIEIKNGQYTSTELDKEKF
jgi:hypothetical protein